MALFNVTGVGMADQQTFSISLSELNGEFFNRNFLVVAGVQSTVLPIALEAIRTDKPVVALLESYAEGSPCFAISLVNIIPPAYFPVLSQKGIGGFDLLNTADRAFAFDYDGSGMLDHLVLYRSAPNGKFSILERQPDRSFKPVNLLQSGVGGFPLTDAYDRIIPFDYDGSGKLDHLLHYRAGTGNVEIFNNSNGTLTPVLQSNSGFVSATGQPIYDLSDQRDGLIAYDAAGSGKRDHLIAYRPGTGRFVILSNDRNGRSFTAVYTSNQGILNFKLDNPLDRVIPYDFYHNGALGSLILYRPGSQLFYVAAHEGVGVFVPILESHAGIAGYDFKETSDTIFAFDYDGRGKLDHLVFYRPGGGNMSIVTNSVETFYPVASFKTGLGGDDLSSTADRLVPFDYDADGYPNDIFAYRAGSGNARILKRTQ